MNDINRRLPDAELDIMQVIWSCTPPVSAADIIGRVNTIHPMAETTLQTLLSRLAEKGYLHIESRKRKKYYTPSVTRESYQISQSRSFFQKVCGGNLSAFANALCEGGLTKEEIAQLRLLLEEDDL